MTIRPSDAPSDVVVPLRRRAPLASVQGALALDLHAHLDPPAPPPAPCRLRGDVVPLDGSSRGRLEQWARRYVQAAVEIVGGDRPASQLVRWTARDVHRDLARRAHLVAQAAARRTTPLDEAAVRPQVLGVRTCVVTERAAEVSAHVRYGRRSRAVALRFELRRDRWICTALDFA
ncbi:Rv3235 family protein [Nocardioides sp. GCM10027113]|uniref:Rv3235 family protein n=1 Tax=unclassified Nocardioides TaxID=2615069 RepID=UPI003610A4B1